MGYTHTLNGNFKGVCRKFQHYFPILFAIHCFEFLFLLHCCEEGREREMLVMLQYKNNIIVYKHHKTKAIFLLRFPTRGFFCDVCIVMIIFFKLLLLPLLHQFKESGYDLLFVSVYYFDIINMVAIKFCAQ
jgi:hypothetical protein